MIDQKTPIKAFAPPLNLCRELVQVNDQHAGPGAGGDTSGGSTIVRSAVSIRRVVV
jgi:hypothetical protein